MTQVLSILQLDVRSVLVSLGDFNAMQNEADSVKEHIKIQNQNEFLLEDEMQIGSSSREAKRLSRFMKAVDSKCKNSLHKIGDLEKQLIELANNFSKLKMVDSDTPSFPNSNINSAREHDGDDGRIEPENDFERNNYLYEIKSKLNEFEHNIMQKDEDIVRQAKEKKLLLQEIHKYKKLTQQLEQRLQMKIQDIKGN
jgi:hypothetical protein